MEIPIFAKGFTVYTKADCFYCDKVKRLLTEHKETFYLVPCDNYLTERDEFLAIMDQRSGTIHRTFPFVFTGNTFIGGCDDTEKYLVQKQKQLSFDDDF